MPIHGSLSIIANMIGGDKVLKQMAEMQKMGEQLGNNPINVRVQAGGVQSLNAQLTSTQQTLTRFSQSWDRTLQGIARFSDGLTHAGQVAATFAYRLALITAPFDLLIAKSTQFTIGLEYNLAKVGTQLDGTLEKIRQFTRESKQISIDLQTKYGVNAIDTSQSLYYLVSSGVEQRQAQAALDPLARLAAVTQTSPAVASQALVAAMNVFGKQLERIPDLVDRANYSLEVMFDATRLGRFEFSDFATQFGRSAEQMNMANATFEETAAMLATLSQVFTPSQASTTLNSFAKAFLNPIEKAKDAFKALQVDLYETVDGRVIRKTFDAVFSETMDKLRSVALTDEKTANELMGDLFGDMRGGRGAQMLIDPRNDALYENNKRKILEDTDNISKAWALMSEQIQTSINQTIGMFFKLGDSIVKYLEPTIRGGLAGLQSIFKTLGDNPKVAQTFAEIGAALSLAAPAALVLATALMGAGGLITAIATLMTPAYLIGFSLLISKLAPSLTAAGGAVERFGGGIKGVFATIAEAAHQLGLISDKDTDNIFEKLGLTRDTESVNNVKTFVSELRKLGDDAAKVGDGIKSIAEGVGQLIDNISKGRGILGFLSTTIQNIAGFVGGDAGANTAKGLGLSGSGGIATGLDLAIGGMVVAKLGSMIVGALSKVGIMNVTAGAVNVAGVPTAAAGGAAAAGIGGVTLPGVLAAGGAAFVQHRFFEDIKNSLATSTIFRAADFGNPFTSVIAGIVNEISKFFTGRGFLDGISKQLDAGFADFPNVMGGFLQVLVANIFDALQKAAAVSMSEGTVGVSTLIVEGIASLASSIAQGVFTHVNNAVSGFWTFLGVSPPTPTGAFPFPIAPSRAGLASPFPASVGSVGKAGKSSPDYLWSKVDLPVAGLKRAVDGTAYQVNRLGDAAKEAAEKFASAIRSILGSALDSTDVTDADVEASKAGTYQDKPDEFRRRLLGLPADADPYTFYGEEFGKQYALAQKYMPGATPGAIAGAFENRSLFANMTPDEIQSLWNIGAFQNSFNTGIAGTVGTENLMQVMQMLGLGGVDPFLLERFKQTIGVAPGTQLGLPQLLGGVSGTGGLGSLVSGTGMPTAEGGLSEETVALFENFANILERIKAASEITLKVTFGEESWNLAKDKILEAEQFILDHLAAYANVFIKITAKFSQEGSGGSGADGEGSSGSGQYPEAEGGDKGAEGRLHGGYVRQGRLYKLTEQDYEYVLPTPIVKFIESILGGSIQSPVQIEWLIKALARGKTETLNQFALWAGGVKGQAVDMPAELSSWIDQIKFKGHGTTTNLEGFLSGQGLSSGGSSGGAGGGGGSGGEGFGSDALISTLNSLIAAINKLYNLIESMRGGFSPPPAMAGALGGFNYAAPTGGGSFGGDTLNFYGNITIPDKQTFDGFVSDMKRKNARQMRSRTNHGQV